MTVKSRLIDHGASQIATFLRLLPLLVLGAGFFTFFWLGWDRYLSFQALKDNKDLLSQWRDEHYFMAVLSFVGAYGVLSGFSVPVGLWMTLAGGFMFGTLAGGFLSLLGATLGAMAIFFAARFTLADVLKEKCVTAIAKMEVGFKENQLSYMLTLRLVPIFPFWLVNLVPAFLDVSPRTYLTGTLFGMIPGALVYASVGNGLSTVFENGSETKLDIIFSANIRIPIVGVAALAFIPAIYKKFSKAKTQH